MKLCMGRFARSVDDKGRLTLPPKVRQCFGEASVTEVVVVVDRKKHALCIFDEESYLGYLDSFFQNGWNPRDDEEVNLRDDLTTYATNCEIDKANRIALPSDLREAAGVVANEIIVRGCFDHFEIVDRKEFEAREAERFGLATPIDDKAQA